MISSIIIHRPRFHKVCMPGVNERMCGFPRVSTLAPVSAVSDSLIAVTLWDRQACAKTMASKSWRLTATDSHLPPKHTSGPLRSLSLRLSLSVFSLSVGGNWGDSEIKRGMSWTGTCHHVLFWSGHREHSKSFKRHFEGFCTFTATIWIPRWRTQSLTLVYAILGHKPKHGMMVK